MKKFLVSLFLIAITSIGFSQTTPISLTQIAAGNADLNYTPYRAAEEWSTQHYANIPNAGVNEPMSNGYYRFHYTDIQKYSASSTVYDWSAFDAQVQRAINRGGQAFSFAIMPICSFCSGHGNQEAGDPAPGGAYLYYPLWLHTAMQAEATKDIIYNGAWFPNWNSPTWIAAWKAMYAALNTHIMNTSYNGIPFKNVIFVADIGSYGETGEWTNNVSVIGKPQQPTIATLDSLISAVVNGLYTFQCQAISPMFDGNQFSNTLIPPEVGYYALTLSNGKGKLGFRRESWGRNINVDNQFGPGNPIVYNGLNFGTAIGNIYKYAPITGEPCCTTPGTAYNLLPQQIIDNHVSTFGNGNVNGGAGDDGVHAGQDGDPPTIANNFRAASKNAGYKMTITSGLYSTAPVSGGPLRIQVNYSNFGVAPLYKHWTVLYELMSSNLVVKTFTSTFDPFLFQVGTLGVDETFTLAGVLPGTYRLRMRIVDPVGYMKPLPLYINGRDADGGYTLAASLVVGASSVPISYAGADQTITLPASSVNLSGSGSSNATSYSWTRISGPNTPTIVTSTGVTTAITGLTSGTYIFQLAINGGVSTDQVQVVVNPASSGVHIFTLQTPTSVTDNDHTAQVGHEVGLKFRTAVAGTITGVRFYKTTGLSGTHTGELYNAAGTRLGSVVFTGETSTGWQDATFSSAISVTANTTYMVAMFSSDGYYVEDNDYFLTVGLTNGPLTALKDGVDGCNGPYLYTATAAFPTSCYRSANYWIDVTFSAGPVATANAGADLAITFPTNSVVLDGSASTGTGNTYAWTQMSGPNTAAFGSPNSIVTNATSLAVGTYVFRLTLGTGSTDDVTVVVNPAPTVVAAAGVDQNVTLPLASITLNGTGSIGASSYLWTQVTGPNSASIATISTATTTVSGLVAGVYTFQLSINSGASTDQISIVVNPAPVVPTTSNKIIVNLQNLYLQ